MTKLNTLIGLAVLGVADIAHAGPLSRLEQKIEEFNGAMISLGITLTVTGFIMACIAAKFGRGSPAAAMTVLGLGVAISCAKEILGFLTAGGGL